MKKKYLVVFLVLSLLLFVIPMSAKATIVTMDGKCKNKKDSLKCEITLHTSREQVSGVSYQYKEDYDIVSFEQDSIWSLNESNDGGVLLVTKTNQLESGSIPIGTIVMEKTVGSKLLLEDVDISYKCQKKYCDEMTDVLEIDLQLEGEKTKASSFEYTWILVACGIVFLLLLVLFVKRRKKK